MKFKNSLNYLLEFLILIYLLSKTDSQLMQISQTNVLLPICKFSRCPEVYQKVSAKGGCFKWREYDDKGLIQIKPLKNLEDNSECISKVLITARSSDPNAVTDLIATDSYTGKSFTCRVGFGYINKLKIEKRFDQVNIDESVELIVEAYNERNNKFSSVAGMVFNWKILGKTGIADLTKLSLYKEKKLSSIRGEVEKCDECYSDIVMLKGINPGKIDIQVSIKDSNDPEIAPAVTTVYIKEEFTISPLDAYVLIDHHLTFEVKIKNLGDEYVPVTGTKLSNYAWDLAENSNCGSIDGSGKFTAPNKICNTVVICKDKRLDYHDKVKTTIHVVQKVNLGIGYKQITKEEFEEFPNLKVKYSDLKKDTKWELVDNGYYYAQHLLFYESNPVYFDEGKLTFQPNLNEIVDYTSNNEIKYYTPTKEKFTFLADRTTNLQKKNIKSSVNFFYTEDNKYDASIMIYKKIKIEKFNMPYFILPYLGREVSQDLYLKVTGGSGNYLVTSNKESVAHVDDEGVIWSNEPGVAKVFVRDTVVKENFDEIEIHVKDINSISYFEERQEIFEGDSFSVSPIASFDDSSSQYNQMFLFTNCSRLKLDENNLRSFAELIEKFNYHLPFELHYKDLLKYIQENENEILEKINKAQKNSNTEYLKYINYGICSIEKFKSLKEGSAEILFKSQISDNYENKKGIVSQKPAYIQIYSKIKIKPIIDDPITIEMLNKNKYILNPDVTKTYIIPKDSHIELNFYGGINKWQEYPSDYTESIYLLDENQSLKTIDKDNRIQLTIHDKKLNAICMGEGFKNNYALIIENKKNDNLLKPGKSKIHFTIGCYSPSSLSILVMSERERRIEMFDVPQRDGIEYFKKENSLEIMRLYGFDESKRLFLNLIDLKGYWNSYSLNQDDKDVNGYWDEINEDKFNDYENLDKSIALKKSNEFIQNVILFKKYGKEFFLKYTLKNNFRKQSIKLNLIGPPLIIPQEAKIYARDENKYHFDVEGGSGDFEFKVEPEGLLKLNVEKNNNIYVQAKQIGKAKIIVYDKILKLSTYAFVYIIDVETIELIGGGPIVVDAELKVKIKVTDNFGNEMNPNVTKNIKLIPEYINIDNGIELKLNENHTAIIAKGLKPRIYKIFVKDEYTGYSSNKVDIEVFDKIKIFPPKLLMYPGESYTLSITGGPNDHQKISKKFKMNDEGIATIVSSEIPQVTALSIGEAKLTINLVYNSKETKLYQGNTNVKEEPEIICTQDVDIIVAVPDSVEIMDHSSSRKIFTNSTVRLLANVKYKEEYFTNGIGPIEYFWSTNNIRLAKIKYYSNPLSSKVKGNPIEECTYDNIYNGVCSGLFSVEDDPNPSNSIGVFMTTLQEGEVQVTVKCAIKVFNNKTNQFTTYEVISNPSKFIIGDELYVNIPSYLNSPNRQTGYYMVPFNVEHVIYPNKKTEIKYTIVKQIDVKCGKAVDNIINDIGGGRISTSSNSGFALMELKQTNINENYNLISTYLTVFVTDFKSIFGEKSYYITDMQVGQDFLIKVKIQHDSGYSFAERFEKLPLSIAESHPNVAKAELIESNSFIKIHAQNMGSTNIIIYHPKTNKIYDVFKINVNKDITQLNPILLNLGGSIKLLEKEDKERRNKLTENAEWISENPEIVKIDKYKGEAIALREGTSNLNLRSFEGKVRLMLKVDVRKIKNAQLDMTSIPPSLTDIKESSNYQSEYNIPIIYETEQGVQFTKEDDSSEINHCVNFKCSTENSNIIVVSSDVKNNNCVVKIRDNLYTKSNIIKPKDLTINIKTESCSTSNSKYSAEFKQNLPFSSAFHIKDNVKSINFNTKKKDHIIYLDNLNDLKIKISNENYLKYEIKDNNDEKYIRFYVPESVTDEFSNLSVNIVNILTDQTFTIICNFTTKSGSTLFFGLVSQESFTDFITMILLVAIIIILIYYISNYNKTSGETENYYEDDNNANNNMFDNFMNQQRFQ